MIAIRKQYMEVMKKGCTERKFRNKTRLVCEEEDYYLEKYCPFKRSHSQGEVYEKLVVKIDHIIFKRKFLHVVQKVR